MSTPLNLESFVMPHNYTQIIKNDLTNQSDPHSYHYSIQEYMRSSWFRSQEHRVVYLYQHSTIATTIEIIAALKQLGLQPASAKENIALSIISENFRSLNVVALGQSGSFVDSCTNIRCVPAYHRWSCQQTLFYVQTNPLGWKPFWQFTAVPA